MMNLMMILLGKMHTSLCTLPISSCAGAPTSTSPTSWQPHSHSLKNSDPTFSLQDSVSPVRKELRIPPVRAHPHPTLGQMHQPKFCFPISSTHCHSESSCARKAQLVFSLSFQPLYVRIPNPTPSPYQTVLLELFVSQVVTGSPWHIKVHPLLCSIIYVSFKYTSLPPLVTPCHLPGRLWSRHLLRCSLSQMHFLLPLDHQAWSTPFPSSVLPLLFSSLPSPKPSHPRNICQGFANSHFFICWGKSHLCI